MATLQILYGHPTDPAAFERYSVERHLPWASETMPGVQSASLRRILGTPDGEAPRWYRNAEMTWADAASLREALESEGGKAVLADLENFATGGTEVLIGEEDEGS